MDDHKRTILLKALELLKNNNIRAELGTAYHEGYQTALIMLPEIRLEEITNGNGHKKELQPAYPSGWRDQNTDGEDILRNVTGSGTL